MLKDFYRDLKNNIHKVNFFFIRILEDKEILKKHKVEKLDDLSFYNKLVIWIINLWNVEESKIVILFKTLDENLFNFFVIVQIFLDGDKGCKKRI